MVALRGGAGRRGGVVMGWTFSAAQPGFQPGTCDDIHSNGYEAQPPIQREIAILARIDGPDVVDPELVAGCESFRDACRLCWALRRIRGMTMRTAAEHCGCHVPHMSDYLARDDKASRRSLPANYIPAFESVTGNAAITQWLAAKAGLTVAESAGWKAAA